MGRLPYCFVVMPFGKPHPDGGAVIDFDRVYEAALAPTIRAAGLEPYRDDLTAAGGIVQKHVYEALMLCDFVVADLTVENANVFYELGVRHAVRPASTVAVTARPEAIPFDAAHLRAVRYELDDRHVLGGRAAEELRAHLGEALAQVREMAAARAGFSDSPLFQLVEGWRPPPPASMKTDLFAGRVAYEHHVKTVLSQARRAARHGGQGRDEARLSVTALEDELGDPAGVEAGVLVDVLLTYRALEDWDSMLRVADAMPPVLRQRATIVEQRAFALNRRARRRGQESDADEALHVLQSLVEEGRATSETFGLIGRVYKDRWRRATTPLSRRGALDAAVQAYSRGSRLDMTDPYPGINACTLMTIRAASEDAEQVQRLLPVVEYATECQLTRYTPTYWMFATLFEAAALRDARGLAEERLAVAIGAISESWEPRTTVETLDDLLAANSLDHERKAWLTLMREELLATA